MFLFYSRLDYEHSVLRSPKENFKTISAPPGCCSKDAHKIKKSRTHYTHSYSFYWLPIGFRIVFKILFLNQPAAEALNCLYPQNIRDWSIGIALSISKLPFTGIRFLKIKDGFQISIRLNPDLKLCCFLKRLTEHLNQIECFYLDLPI